MFPTVRNRRRRARALLLGATGVLWACGAPVHDAASKAPAARDAAGASAPARDAAGLIAQASILDDFGDTLRLARPAARAVSLNPVITEALFALHAESRMVGRSHWDSAPVAATKLPDLGNGIQPNVEAVLAARPDLVILYATEANRAAAAAFHRAGVATLSLRTDRVREFARMMVALGVAFGDPAGARAIADSVTRSIEAVRALPIPARQPTVFWHAWDNPVITIGTGSFQHELVVAAGALNVFGDLSAPSPQVTLESVAERNPEFVLAGPKTAAALRRDARWQSVPAVRAGRILVVDTAVIGRPGVRMGEAAHALRALLDSAVRARP